MDTEARILAFYLPQYHAIPENDQWWGPGFTEWTNVRRARPWFDGHDQPRVPGSLGYYDLRDVGVQFAQAELASKHGIAGFCYYAYWFAGRRLLERPLAAVHSNPDLAMPYAICWANEPWSRRWDGSEDEVLMPQRHGADTDQAFIDDMAEHLADPRYIRIGARPLLVIYRASLLVDPRRTTDALRERALKLGLGELYLAMVQAFGHMDPMEFGFDAAVEFPPHGYERSGWLPGRTRPRPFAGFEGEVRDYQGVVAQALRRPIPPYTWFRGVMPDWDNTPRRGARATVYEGSTPELFREWLEATLRFTYLFREVPERLVFVNAWNEWGEGAYLEPDKSRGSSYLEATSVALDSTGAMATETARQMLGDPDDTRALEAARATWQAAVKHGSDEGTSWPQRLGWLGSKAKRFASQSGPSGRGQRDG